MAFIIHILKISSYRNPMMINYICAYICICMNLCIYSHILTRTFNIWHDCCLFINSFGPFPFLGFFLPFYPLFLPSSSSLFPFPSIPSSSPSLPSFFSFPPSLPFFLPLCSVLAWESEFTHSNDFMGSHTWILTN